MGRTFKKIFKKESNRVGVEMCQDRFAITIRLTSNWTNLTQSMQSYWQKNEILSCD